MYIIRASSLEKELDISANHAKLHISKCVLWFAKPRATLSTPEPCQFLPVEQGWTVQGGRAFLERKNYAYMLFQ